MPNHFHLIVSANEASCKLREGFAGKPITELSFRIGKLLSSYSQAINKQNKTTGSLFQQKTKAKDLTNTQIPNKQGNYLVNAMHYCHQNPWKAGLVKKIEDWRYSSFLDYAGLRNGTLCNTSLLMELTGYDLDNFYSDSYKMIDDFDDTDFL
jgi:putative transposase